MTLPRLSAPLQAGLILSGIFHIVLSVVLVFFLVLHQSHIDASLLKSLWNAWDGNTYAYLSTEGYVTTGEHALYIVFYPLYPLLMRGVELIIPQPHIAGVLVTLVTSLLGHAVFYAFLIEKGLKKKQAFRILLLFFLCPATIYFTLVCTEGLFLFLAASFLYTLQRKQFWLASILGFFAATTRIVGITLIIPYILFFFEEKLLPLNRKSLFKGLLIPLGFVLYLGINVALYQNPFHYQTVMQSNWNKSIENPIIQVVRYIPSLMNIHHTPFFTFAIDILATYAVPVIVALYLLQQRKKAWVGGVAWTVSMWAIVAAQSFWLSNARYVSLMLPLYVMLESLTRKVPLLYILCILILGYIALRGIEIFTIGGWLY